MDEGRFVDEDESVSETTAVGVVAGDGGLLADGVDGLAGGI